MTSPTENIREILNLLETAAVVEGPNPGMTPGKRKIKQDTYDKQNGLCWMCEQPFAIQQLTMDHTKPRALGGDNSAGNFTLMCYRCNQLKQDLELVSKHVDHDKKELTVVFKLPA